MADTKLTGLPEDTAPLGTDLLYTADDPTVAPLSKKALISNVVGYVVTTVGDIMYATGSRVLARLGIGTAGQKLRTNSGATAPVWSDDNRYLIFSLIDSATDVAVDTDVGGDFVIPFSGTILQSDSLKNQLAATNTTAGITGTMVVDIHLNGTTIMDTNKLDIETTEKSTVDAVTQPDLTTTSITANDTLTFDIDTVHSGTAAKGLKVYMAIRED